MRRFKLIVPVAAVALSLALTLGVASAHALDTSLTYTFPSNSQSWTFTGAAAWAANDGGGSHQPLVAGDGLLDLGTVVGGSATQPNVSVPTYPTSVVVKLVVADWSTTTTSSLTAAYVEAGTSHSLTLSAATAGACGTLITVDLTPQCYTGTYSGSMTAGDTSHLVVTQNDSGHDVMLGPVFETYTQSAPPVVSYPSLDLTSLSTNMGAFFSFIAPALWIIAGIGLGGLIVGKVRHLF